ncbi:unnamed protein product [Rotaria sordida]|uniref:F-box domain-containing protein n=1 Tax=Rotaria sordida TaxID=392033 RepID=A0A815J7F3_9BILA|nr:unnamed protein product [Rotaria sordida]
MESLSIQLNDLPNEILLIILKKLPDIDVLYSLIGVNKRLDTIVQDSIFTRYLTFMTSCNDLSPIAEPILNQFCAEILPKIRHKILWLNLEPSSMDRILLSTNYPNLCGLALYNLISERARELFSNKSYLIRIFKNQLSSIVIHINKCQESTSSIKDINIFIFTQIFTMFKNLQYLNFSPFNGSNYHRLTFGVSPPNILSSTLLQLRVVIDSYEDCLYLLDGRFNQLNTIYVTICLSKVPTLSVINNKKKLPNLKCFQLTHRSILSVYNNILIPLLHRMSNLEELGLYFDSFNAEIIDGYNLEENILNYMTKLKKFQFNIRSIIPFNNQVNLPSNNAIQNTFKNFKNSKIISCIDCLPKENQFHCHIYSYPYELIYYNYITNNFRGGLFKHVYKISLVDELPFEHEFFLQITKSFPFVSELRIHNQEPQKNNKQQYSIIEYPHLTKLAIVQSHENYLEQFLNNSKMYLSNNIYLFVDYNSLQRVTDNFTSDTTRMNCTKIKCLNINIQPELSLDLIKDYFPHAELR